jgi:hypothetical protein
MYTYFYACVSVISSLRQLVASGSFFTETYSMFPYIRAKVTKSSIIFLLSVLVFLRFHQLEEILFLLAFAYFVIPWGLEFVSYRCVCTE